MNGRMKANATAIKSIRFSSVAFRLVLTVRKTLKDIIMTYKIDQTGCLGSRGATYK